MAPESCDVPMRSEGVTTWRCDCCGEPMPPELEGTADFPICPACGWPAWPPREAAEEKAEDEAETE
jgi:hypothetical protein